MDGQTCLSEADSKRGWNPFRIPFQNLTCYHTVSFILPSLFKCSLLLDVLNIVNTGWFWESSVFHDVLCCKQFRTNLRICELSGKVNLSFQCRFSTITSRVKLVETIWTFIKRLSKRHKLKIKLLQCTSLKRNQITLVCSLLETSLLRFQFAASIISAFFSFWLGALSITKSLQKPMHI